MWEPNPWPSASEATKLRTQILPMRRYNFSNAVILLYMLCLVCYRLQVLDVHAEHDQRGECSGGAARARLDLQAQHEPLRPARHTAEDTLHRDGKSISPSTVNWISEELDSQKVSLWYWRN